MAEDDRANRGIPATLAIPVTPAPATAEHARPLGTPLPPPSTPMPATSPMPISTPAPPRDAPPPIDRPDRGARGGGGGGSNVALIAAIAGIGCLGLLGLAVVGSGAAWFVFARSSEASVASAYPAPPPPSAPAYGGGAGAGPTVGSAITDPYASERVRLPIPPGTPSRGAPDARVTIVMVGDFQCPFCARADQTMQRVLERSPADVRLVWMDYPLDFHPSARMAARAANEAQLQGGDARFWAMHDLLFANQTGMDRASILALGAQAGLDPVRLRAAVDGTMHDRAIEEDTALAVRLGASGTPAFFLNGRLLAGAQPLEAFQRIVDEEVLLAMRYEATGVPRAQLYDAITARGSSIAAAPRPAATPPRAAEDPTRVYRVPVGTSPVQGPPDALVTIVLFTDFQCPFCSRLAPTLARVRETYGSDVRIVFKHNPLAFHDRALPAALASMAVYDELGSDGFFRMHDVLFENQRALEDADLVRYAREIGASGPRVQAAIGGATHRAAIQADQDLAASLDARGTPTCFINGHVLTGAQPYEAFTARIDQELVAARAMVAAGTPRDRVYDTIMATAR